MSKKIITIINNKSSTANYEVGQFEKGVKRCVISTSNASTSVSLINSALNSFNLASAIGVSTYLDLRFPDPAKGETPMSFMISIPSKAKVTVIVLEEGDKGVPMRTYADKYAEYISLEDSLINMEDTPTLIPETDDNPTTIPESEV